MHSSSRRTWLLFTVLVLLVVSASSLPALQNPSTDFKLTDDMHAAVDRISAASLREHLKFIS